MNASKLIDNLIANFDDRHSIMFADIRRIIQDADPEIIEKWK